MIEIQPTNYQRPVDQNDRRHPMARHQNGAVAEYQALVDHVIVRNLQAVRRVRIRGTDAEGFVNFVVTRDIAGMPVMESRYGLLCNEAGGIINDPLILRLAEDEFWLSITNPNVLLWLQGINLGMQFNVEIQEMDLAPVRIQGRKSTALMGELLGSSVHQLGHRQLLEARIAGHPVVVAGMTTREDHGYEIYLRHASPEAGTFWKALIEAGQQYRLTEATPPPHRRISAGVLRWGQDMDTGTLPFQVGLGYQIPQFKRSDYVGRQALEELRERIDVGDYPYHQILVGLLMGGAPITEQATDFWLISDVGEAEPLGHLSSSWYSPEHQANIALGYVPIARSEADTRLSVWLPEAYREHPDRPVEAMVVDLPFQQPLA